MKKLFIFIGIILSSCVSFCQDNIKNLIKENLETRYTNVEIVSFTEVLGPDIKKLFNYSLAIKINAADCKLNISRIILSYYKNEISFNTASNLCKKEIIIMDGLASTWEKAYHLKTENGYLVKYRYGKADGTKITKEEYFSLDEERYKEGNYPYLQDYLDYQFAEKYYREVVDKYGEFLLDVAKGE